MLPRSSLLRRCAAALAALSACADPPPAPSESAPDPAASAFAPAPPESVSAAMPGPTSAPTGAPATAGSAAPDAVTQASQPHDDGASVLAEARVDGAALRKRHVARLSQDTSPVTLLSGEGPRELGQRICEAVVPRRPPSTPVLLKPNLCGFDSIKDPAKSGGDDGVRGRTTDPEFARGVIQCLKGRGHQKITVAEGCGHSHEHWVRLMDLNGYAAMSREEGVRLVAMDDDGVFDKEGDRPGQPLAVSGMGATQVPTLLLPRVLAEHLDRGLFISLPKVKAHRYAVVSVGIKNLQGTVMLSDRSPAYKQKWRMHRELGEYIKQRRAKGPEDRKLYVDSLRIFAARMVAVTAWDGDFAGMASGVHTRARFLWSKDALHVLFELSGAGLFTDRSRPVAAERQKLFEEDCVEIFIAPDPASPRRYAEIELGPFGHFLDLMVDLDARKYDTTWSSGLRVAATQRAGAREATVEAALTAPEITRALRAGAILPMGLFRMEGREPRHYLAWSPARTKKPNFHVPEAFGALVLDP